MVLQRKKNTLVLEVVVFYPTRFWVILEYDTATYFTNINTIYFTNTSTESIMDFLTSTYHSAQMM